MASITWLAATWEAQLKKRKMMMRMVREVVVKMKRRRAMVTKMEMVKWIGKMKTWVLQASKRGDGTKREAGKMLSENSSLLTLPTITFYTEYH